VLSGKIALIKFGETKIGIAFSVTLSEVTGFGGGWRWRGFGDGMAITTVDKAVFPVAMIVATLLGSHFLDFASRELHTKGR
jgi:hypothetical protein